MTVPIRSRETKQRSSQGKLRVVQTNGATFTSTTSKNATFSQKTCHAQIKLAETDRRKIGKSNQLKITILAYTIIII